MLPNVHVLTLRDSQEKSASIFAHLDEERVAYKKFVGMDSKKWGLSTRNPFEFDGSPVPYFIEDRFVCMHLSHYWMWRTFDYCGYDEATILEDDCRLTKGWADDYSEARSELPKDWDILMLGSCCTEGRPSTKVGPNLFNVKYPLCTHAYVVRKKALQTLITTQEQSGDKIDISLFRLSYPLLNVYTILPRIADQEGTPLHP